MLPVLTVGEVLVDWLSLSTCHGSLAESFLQSDSFVRSLGGNAANVAVGLSRLGTRSSVVARIGNDLPGFYLRNRLEFEKVDISNLIFDERYPTAQCYVLCRQDKEPYFYNWPLANACHMLEDKDVLEETIKAHCLMHTTGVSLLDIRRHGAIERAVDLANKHNIVVSLDVGMTKSVNHDIQKQTYKLMCQSDIIKFNHAELESWSESEGASIEEMLEKIRGFFPRATIVATLAESGAMIANENLQVFIEPFRVNSHPLGEIGAGDSFMAGLIHGLVEGYSQSTSRNGKDFLGFIHELKGEEWQKFGQIASASGALATRQVSASEPLPSREEVLELIYQKSKI